MHEYALECWNKTLELDPEITAALWSKALCYESMGNYKSAYQVWMELIKWLEEKGLEIEVEEPVLVFMNRLSDYLFVLARKECIENNGNEIIWDYTCI